MYANFIATCSLIVAILSIPGFIKHFKGVRMRQLKANPYSKILLSAIAITAIFYFAPFPEIHFGKQPVKIVYKDSAYKKSPVKILIDTSLKATKPRHYSALSKRTIPVKHETVIKEDNSLKVDNSPNSLNIAGKNNKVYVNAEKELTKDGIAVIVARVDSFRDAYNIPKTVVLSTWPYSNAPLIYNQLNEYFSQRGYQVNPAQMMGNGPAIIGFRVNREGDNSAVWIDLGYFK